MRSNRIGPIIKPFSFRKRKAFSEKKNMFIFGHLGITLGIAFLVFYTLKIVPDRRLYSFILTGAILPDLIDKPIGEILLANSISNGRLFAHTLLFVFILLLIGTCLYKRNGSEEKAILFLAFASFLHLCEDRMWFSPKTLFYPLFGFDFPQGVIEQHWWEYFLMCFFGTYSPLTGGIKHKYAFVSELIGISILLMFIFITFLKSNHKITHRGLCPCPRKP